MNRKGPRVLHLLIATTAAVVSLTISANAQGTKQEFAAAIGRQGYGRCHMDSCGFFIIDAAVPSGSGPKGILFSVSYRGWGATYRRTDDGRGYDRKPISGSKPETRVSLVFCSKTNPVDFSFYEGKWHEMRLRPGDDQAVFGVNESSYTFYFAACHNYITKSPYLPSDLAKKLGYNLHGGFTDAESDAPDRMPLDVLK